MTRQQADKILKAFTDISACDSNGEEVSELAKELREAVEKQVPRKMKHWVHAEDDVDPGGDYYTCPVCGENLYDGCYAAVYLDFPYCNECGQRIEL